MENVFTKTRPMTAAVYVSLHLPHLYLSPDFYHRAEDIQYSLIRESILQESKVRSQANLYLGFFLASRQVTVD